MALLPPEVQRLGVTTKKQSSALLQVVAVYSPKGSRDALFLSNFATITLLDTLRRVPGVGDATLFGALDYSMRVWLEPRPHVEPRHHARRRGQGGPGAERAGRRRPGRRGAAARRRRLPAQHHHPGPPHHGRGVREHRRARQVRRRAGPGQGHRPGRARRQDQRPDRPLQRQAGRRHPDLPAARRQCAGHRQGRARRDQGAGAALSRRCRLQRHVRHHGVRARPRSRA